MFSLTRPSDAKVRDFLERQNSSQLSYPQVGETRNSGSPTGYVVDHNRIQLGSGAEVFERAKRSLQAWKMFALPWVQLCWSNAPIVENTNVAVLISHFGFWSLNGARIVYVIDDSTECKRFGFAYGTLSDHSESGEERFSVELSSQDGGVWYDLFAFSRPNGVARLAYPLTRTLQKRFAEDSKSAMKRAVESR